MAVISQHTIPAVLVAVALAAEGGADIALSYLIESSIIDPSDHINSAEYDKAVTVAQRYVEGE